MTTSASLTSDHVNYLIFRYLQEAGHESTATAFYRDWHRTSEYRDPENYPFAPVVRRNELISIIQKGLHHDGLEARIRKNEATFNFTRVTSREALGERQRGAAGGLENGVAPQGSTAIGAASRPGSAAKRKGRPSVARIAEQDFPTPAPKRQRRSAGSEGAHLNGDLMEVDAAAASPSAVEAEEDAEAISPTAASEPEMTEIPERYDSMDVAVQTETKTGPKTSTMYWKIDKPQATIFHGVFNPNAGSGSTNTLMAVGESLCRFYQVPENSEDAHQVSSVDEPTLPPSSVVTASAWHPNGNVVVLAADAIRDLPDGSQSTQQVVFAHDCRTGDSLLYLTPPLMEPQGIVLALRHSGDGSKLAVLRTNLVRGSVTMYDSSELVAGKATPIGWCIFEQPTLDITWLGSSTLFVVGEKGLAEHVHFDIGSDPVEATMTMSAEAMRTVGVSDRKICRLPPPEGSNRDYNKICSAVRGDSTVAAIASTQGRRIVIGTCQFEHESDLTQSHAVDVHEQITAMMFQPTSDLKRTSAAVLLATAFEDGSCDLYSHTCLDHDSTHEEVEQQFRKVLTLYLKAGPALALAWSPDGTYLAVAGMDLVQIWDVETLIVRNERTIEKKSGASQKALVTWRPDASAVGRRNGEHEEPARALSEPSLSWSADGESLAFAVDREIAVIRFRPSLNGRDEREQLNGHVSPQS